MAGLALPVCQNSGCIAARVSQLRSRVSPTAVSSCVSWPLQRLPAPRSGCSTSRSRVVGRAASVLDAPQAIEDEEEDWNLIDDNFDLSPPEIDDNVPLSAQGVFEEDPVLDDKKELYKFFSNLIEHDNYTFKQGDIVSGYVYEVQQRGSYVDIGAKSMAFLPNAEASLCKINRSSDVVKRGDQRDFVIVQDKRKDGEIWVSLKQQEYALAWYRIRQLKEADAKVKGEIVASNRGGLIVAVQHIRGFLPASHLAQQVEDLEQLVGQQMDLKFLEVDEEEERCVFSARNASRQDVHGFEIGDVITGVVNSVKPYGAFVDLPNNVSGLLHISQISEERVSNVEDVLSVGDELKVMVLSQDSKKLALSTRKLERTRGDMLRDPQMVFQYADEVAAKFKEQLRSLEQSRYGDEALASVDMGASVSASIDADDL